MQLRMTAILEEHYLRCSFKNLKVKKYQSYSCLNNF